MSDQARPEFAAGSLVTVIFETSLGDVVKGECRYSIDKDVDVDVGTACVVIDHVADQYICLVGNTVGWLYRFEIVLVGTTSE